MGGERDRGGETTHLQRQIQIIRAQASADEQGACRRLQLWHPGMHAHANTRQRRRFATAGSASPRRARVVGTAPRSVGLEERNGFHRVLFALALHDEAHHIRLTRARLTRSRTRRRVGRRRSDPGTGDAKQGRRARGPTLRGGSRAWILAWSRSKKAPTSASSGRMPHCAPGCHAAAAAALEKLRCLLAAGRQQPGA